MEVDHMRAEDRASVAIPQEGRVPVIDPTHRRAFLRFLATSPLMGYSVLASDLVEQLLGSPVAAQTSDARAIRSVREALNVFDFEAAAREKLSFAHYTFVSQGNSSSTGIANREGFKKYQVRLRRLTGITSVDQSVDIFGVKWDSPIYLCPVGRMNAFHPEGNVAVARGAKAKRTLQMMSGAGSLEAVNTARGEPVWVCVQGAPPDAALIKQLEAAGCPVLIWTVDAGEGGNQLGARAVQRAGVANLERKSDAACGACHQAEGRVTLSDSMSSIMGVIGGLRSAQPEVTGRTWNDVRRVRDMMRMKLILKGITTREDAELSVRYGADAIVVSNHGGQADEAGRGSIECLPEVVEAVAGRIPVFIDSGFRSGTDIFKALALGATAVGIGRPYVWGLASFGDEGVQTVIELLRRELQVLMAQANAPSVGAITRAALVTQPF
jgi:isopentenyl diphosphate isomerase/L-lactate dehydrogenase-like FMN-dependent dehydrogenase